MSFKIIFVSVLTLFTVTCSTASASSGSFIVGGDFAEPGQFPHQIFLKKRRSFTCGGSIYNEKYIITAAHCVISHGTTPVLPSILTVVAGTNSLNQGGVQKFVRKVIPHEKYGKFVNDIALLELTDPLNFTEFIQPIELYEGEVFNGEKTIISGWGRVYHGGPTSNDLKYNNLTIITQPECGRQVQLNHNGVICIGHESDNGACMGDSGGPAVIDGKLVGIANFVMERCGTSYPDGYAFVPFYANWVKENTSQ